MQQTFRKKTYRPISSSIVKKSRTLRPRLIWTSRDSKGGSISFYLKKQNKKIFVKEKRSFIERATYLRSVRFRLRQSFPIFVFLLRTFRVDELSPNVNEATSQRQPVNTFKLRYWAAAAAFLLDVLFIPLSPHIRWCACWRRFPNFLYYFTPPGRNHMVVKHEKLHRFAVSVPVVTR